MAKKIIGGLSSVGKRLMADQPGVQYADPIKPPTMRLSEALGNAGAEGKTLNFTEADRSRVKGKNLGGVGFSGLQQYSGPHRDANTVWGFGNKATAEKKIRQNDSENSLFTTFVGSPQQHRSNSVVIGDAIKKFQDSVKKGVVPREQIMLMNKRLNEITDDKTGAKVFENGFDLTDPSALSTANTFSRRAAVGDVMLGLGVKGPMARLDFKSQHPNTKFTDGSDIENILRRETDPDLVDANTYDVGNRLFVMDGKIIERPDLNGAFPIQVTGTDLGMKYQLVPPDKAMRDFYKEREGRKNKRGKPAPVSYYDLSRAEPSQFVDEDYLTFLQKEGHKDGGAIDIKAADARLEAAMNQRMAQGGGVDIAAADARLEAAMNGMPMQAGGIAKGAAKGFKRLFNDDVLPAAERDANKAKFLAESKDQRRFYHGNQADINSFIPSRKGVFVSPDPEFASKFSEGATGRHGPNVMPVRVQVKNPFDYENPAHMKAVREAAQKRYPGNRNIQYELDAIGGVDDSGGLHNNWASVEHPEVQRLIQQLGHDAYYTSEGGTKNLGIYNPNRIKSDIGNRGTYDVDKGDINEADGGIIRMQVGGAAKGSAKWLKRLFSESEEASQAIGKAAESAGMKAPVTANKPLTGLEDFHTSLGDRVRQGAADTQKMVDSMSFRYDKGQRVYTESSAKKNKPPYTILRRTPFGNQVMREEGSLKARKNPETGETMRTPYEPGYTVRYEQGDDWSEFVIPESAIKGDVEMANGGEAFKTLQWREPQKFDGGGIASPEEASGYGYEPKPSRLFGAIKKTAAEMYEEGKRGVASDYERLMNSPLTRAQLAKIAAAQIAGGGPDLASLFTPLINSDALLGAFPAARMALTGMTGSPKIGRKESVLSDERTPYSLSDFTSNPDGTPIGGSDDIIKRAQKAGLMYGGTRPYLDEGGQQVIDPKTDEPMQIRTGRFSLPTEIGASVLGGLGASKLVSAAARNAPDMVRKAESGLNEIPSAVKRPFTPATFTVEATAPDLGQGTSYGFRQGLNDRLLANPKLGTGKTKAKEGQGTYVNTKGELELNPLQAIDVPRAGTIGDGPKSNTGLRQQVAQMGVDLNQEAMAGHRFLPMMTNNIKDASAMLIKTKEGLNKEQIADLARVLGSDMVVTHNPRLGGVVVYPFGPVTKGQIPEEFLTAQSAAQQVLGKGAKIQYGKSDFVKDRLFMDKSEYAGAGAKPMSAEQDALRRSLQGVEKFMFPESVSGIPGSVKAAPIGGLQPWSRGADYPTSVIGRGNRDKTEYQPVNFLTSEEGKRFPSYREAELERAKMLDAWHRTLPSKAR